MADDVMVRPNRPEASGGEKATAWIILAIALGLTVLGYFMNWEKQFAWWDEVIHGMNFFAITLLAAVYLFRDALIGVRNNPFLFVITVTVLGLGLGALWEVAEWAYDQWFAQGDAIQGKTDTLTDLLMDTAGALLAGIVAIALIKDE